MQNQNPLLYSEIVQRPVPSVGGYTTLVDSLTAAPPNSSTITISPGSLTATPLNSSTTPSSSSTSTDIAAI